MKRIERYFETIDEAKAFADLLVDSGEIKYYELSDMPDEYGGIQLYVEYFRVYSPTLIEVTQFGDTYRKYKLG